MSLIVQNERREKGQMRNGYIVTHATPGTLNECSGLEPKIFTLLEKTKLLLIQSISYYEKKNLTETSRKISKDTLEEFNYSNRQKACGGIEAKAIR